MQDRGLCKSVKIKDGTKASENLTADRFETDGAETQLSPTTTPVDAINASVQFRNFGGNSGFMKDVFKN
jgi:hypothetical protein